LFVLELEARTGQTDRHTDGQDAQYAAYQDGRTTILVHIIRSQVSFFIFTALITDRSTQLTKHQSIRPCSQYLFYKCDKNKN